MSANRRAILAVVLILCFVSLPGIIAATAVSALAFYLYRDLLPPHVGERQHVVDQIKQFRQQHGRYPTDQEAKQFVAETVFELELYQMDGDGFYIELSRGQLPTGERVWTYRSEEDRWGYRSQSW